MASDTSMKSTKAAISLYANLLDPSLDVPAIGTISRAPVVFKQVVDGTSQPEDGAASKQQLSAASLRFQPTKRPQLPAQRPKVKGISRVTTLPPNSSVIASEPATTDVLGPVSRPQGRNTLADWTADPDDNEEGAFYGLEKRQRGGRKKRKKTKGDEHVSQNWDDIYDPSRPNNYEEYKHSEEKILELREWKDKLYAHRIVRMRSSDVDSIEDSIKSEIDRGREPARLSFPPPSAYTEGTQSRPQAEPKEINAEVAYTQHTRLLQSNNHAEGASNSFFGSNTPFALTPQVKLPQEPVPGISNVNYPSQSVNLTPAPTDTLRPVISRPPIRYNFPPAPSELFKLDPDFETTLSENGDDAEVAPEDEAPRSLRPGQKGFAERLMSKYGWKKGSGLGASGSGIVNPLRVKVEKQKKRPDSEGGGFVVSGAKGTIVGSKKGGLNAGEETGRFGAMSEVVILLGMVDGMDLDMELEGSGDGGLMQEIGEECGEKYGRVERVYIDRSIHEKTPVFIKFTSQLSALRAVNALEGRIFNGNTITARFFDVDKFEQGAYA